MENPTPITQPSAPTSPAGIPNNQPDAPMPGSNSMPKYETPPPPPPQKKD